MKKLVLFMAVATAIAFASCNNEEATEETTEEAPVEEATEAPAEEVVEDAAPAEDAAVADDAEAVAE